MQIPAPDNSIALLENDGILNPIFDRSWCWMLSKMRPPQDVIEASLWRQVGQGYADVEFILVANVDERLGKVLRFAFRERANDTFAGCFGNRLAHWLVKGSEGRAPFLMRNE